MTACTTWLSQMRPYRSDVMDRIAVLPFVWPSTSALSRTGLFSSPHCRQIAASSGGSFRRYEGGPPA